MYGRLIGVHHTIDNLSVTEFFTVNITSSDRDLKRVVVLSPWKGDKARFVVCRYW